MRTPRVFHPGTLAAGIITLSADAAQHVATVLRLRDGAPLILFNGEGQVYSAKLLTSNKKSVTVQLLEPLTENNESPLQLHLGLAIIKGDRMSYALQKAVELGVTTITPIMTEHTVVKVGETDKAKKQAHWSAIMQNAAEQSQRSRLAILNETTTLAAWLAQTKANLKIFFEPTAEVTLAAITTPPQSVSLLIGPEGGLHLDEILSARSHGFTGLRLGPRILRAETAVAAAISTLQSRWGDFN